MNNKVKWKEVDEGLLEGYLGNRHFFTIEIMSSIYLHEMVHNTVVPEVTEFYDVEEAKKRAESLV